MIRHIVMWSFNRPEDAAHVKQLLETCATLVPGIHEFTVGVPSEGLEANCHAVLVSTYEDEAALAAYQQHPHHQGVVAQIKAVATARHVVDYRC